MLDFLSEIFNNVIVDIAVLLACKKEVWVTINVSLAGRVRTMIAANLSDTVTAIHLNRSFLSLTH